MFVDPQITYVEGDIDSIHLDLTLILNKDNRLTIVDNSELDWKDYVDSDAVFVTHIKPIIDGKKNTVYQDKIVISESKIDQTQELLNEARDLMESFDDCAAMTVGYDKEEYTLTAKQMTLIAGALYMADCKINNEINQNKEDE